MQIARLIRSRWLWLAGALLFLGGLIVAADRVWPLPLKEVNPARVVVDEQGVPLWRFADSEGIWRYPVTIEEVSPRYLEALIQYEDRWWSATPWRKRFISAQDRSACRDRYAQVGQPCRS